MYCLPRKNKADAKAMKSKAGIVKLYLSVETIVCPGNCKHVFVKRSWL
jgi:hypothetical protein